MKIYLKGGRIWEIKPKGSGSEDKRCFGKIQEVNLMRLAEDLKGGKKIEPIRRASGAGGGYIAE